MASTLSEITEIHQSLLTRSRERNSYSVATRMSWAGQRSTTREEDMAYSLLGIFDVNMPLLYSEGGERAFDLMTAHPKGVSFTVYNCPARLSTAHGLQFPARLVMLNCCFQDDPLSRPAFLAREFGGSLCPVRMPLRRVTPGDSVPSLGLASGVSTSALFLHSSRA